jgi:ABC-2 type transport system permease protein
MKLFLKILYIILISTAKTLAPGESIVLSFEVKKQNKYMVQNNSPVIYNGSFINNSSFPSIGYRKWELSDDDVRKVRS